MHENRQIMQKARFVFGHLLYFGQGIMLFSFMDMPVWGRSSKRIRSMEARVEKRKPDYNGDEIGK